MGKKAFSPERIRCCGKKDNEMTESDDALMLRVAREEIKRQAAEIEYLKARLEVSAYHPYDGIVSRDATIKLQDEYIAKLREQEPVNAQLLEALKGVMGWWENAEPLRCGDEDMPKAVFDTAYVAIAAAEAQQAEPSCCPDKAASELEADAARYRYIRTHRIGIKWCELYAGGPLLDEVIDSTMTNPGPSPINSAALRAAAQKESSQ